MIETVKLTSKQKNYAISLLKGNVADYEDLLQDTYISILNQERKGVKIQIDPINYLNYCLINRIKSFNKRVILDTLPDYNDEIVQRLEKESTQTTPELELLNKEREKENSNIIKDFLATLDIPNKQNHSVAVYQKRVFISYLKHGNFLDVSKELNKNYQTCRTQCRMVLAKWKKYVEG